MTFGLKSLLVGMGFVGVAMYLLVVAPAALATLSLAFIWVVLAALLATGIVYGRGKRRAFCVGAMFPVGGTVFALTWMLFGLLAGGFSNIRDFTNLLEHLDRGAFMMRFWAAAGWFLTAVAGIAAVVGRSAWMARKAGGERPEDLP